MGPQPWTLGCSSHLSGPVTCAPVASPSACISGVAPSVVPHGVWVWGTCPRSPSRGSTQTQTCHTRASLISRVPLCLWDPPWRTSPPTGGRGLRIQFQGTGSQGRGHVVELGGALGTPSSLTAPPHVSPRAASPSRPSTTSPSLRSTRRSWWTLRRWAAGGPAWPVVGRAAAASPLGPDWGPGARQSRARG